MKAAQDGLLPDGREGAITVRKDWKKQIKKCALAADDRRYPKEGSQLR